ncbi:MAG: hypothetical protein RLZZ59_437 [Pseudomonadota bacterium]|jgi:S-DNA-T family DNA segregation ATPase FtsK/SpoIIIE
MRLILKILGDYRVQIIIQFALALFLALSLSSYDADDPSWNSYSDEYISNLMGYSGSVCADFLLQLFGAGSYSFVLLVLLWARVLWQNGNITFWSIRIILGIIAVILFSGSAAFINLKISHIAFGGIVGSFVMHYAKFVGPIAPVITFVLGLMLFVWASGYSLYNFLNSLWVVFHGLSSIRAKTSVNTSIGFSIKNLIPAMPKFLAKKSEVANDLNKVNPSFLTQEKQLPLVSSNPRPSMVVGKSFMNIEPMNDELGKTKATNIQRFDTSASNKYNLPEIDLLDPYKDTKTILETSAELEERAAVLMSVLGDFGVRGTMLGIKQGPVVTLYEFEPSAGTKSSRVIGLADDVARSISAISTRIAVIPGKNALGIEIPNRQRQFFSLRELINTSEYNNAHLSLPIILGKDLGGAPAVVDLAKMPHLLVAGTTGSGKSVAINAMIISLLYRHTADTCKFIMIDPKMLELSVYQDIPHLLTPVVTEPGKAVIALKWAVREMENRYRLMSHLNVRNIAGYNARIAEAKASGEVIERTVQTGFDPETGKPIYESMPIDMTPLPFIVVIVDEMADLMLVAGKDIETSIQRLAQMARAAGIHLIMATQRPSVDVITGVIKANFPSRVSFKVTSKIDSRTILGEQGAEQLLGMGDMLYVSSTSSISRLHGPFVDDREVERIAKFLKSQGSPAYINSVTEAEESDSVSSGDIDGDDEESLYNQAVQIVKRDRKVSTSYIQRCLRIGYNRAATIVERMERDGVVSEPSHSGKREILLPE